MTGIELTRTTTWEHIWHPSQFVVQATELWQKLLTKTKQEAKKHIDSLLSQFCE